MNDIQIFNNAEFGEIRTVMIDNEPWFVGNDCAKALGYKNTYNGVSKNVDDEDRRLSPVESTSGIQDTTVINESGLYSLIFGSKLDSAKKFKKWVTSEVLPSLRKTGTYSAQRQLPMTTDEKIQLLAQGNVELKEEIKGVRDDLEALKLDLPILPIEQERITETVRKKGTEILGGANSNAYRNRSIRQKVYKSIYANLKYNFGVKTYRAIKRAEADKAIELIRKFQPPYFLQAEIDNENAQTVLQL